MINIKNSIFAEKMDKKEFEEFMDKAEKDFSKVKEGLIGKWCNSCCKDYENHFVTFRNKHYCPECLNELARLQVLNLSKS